MINVYLMTLIEDEEVTSSIFVRKENAMNYITHQFPDFKKTAEDTKEDVTYWRKPTGEGLLLEKLKVEDQR